MSCDNNHVDITHSAFQCWACEDGFVLNPNEPSGCTVLLGTRSARLPR